MRDELRAAFSFFDKDGSGSITRIELEAGMGLLSYPSMAAGDVVGCVREALADVPGAATTASALLGREDSICFDDFVRAFAYRATAMGSSGELALRVAFGCFDKDGDGSLTNDEFRNALGRLAPVPMDAREMDDLVAQLDANGDGEIEVDEWIAFLRQRFTAALCGHVEYSSGIEDNFNTR